MLKLIYVICIVLIDFSAFAQSSDDYSESAIIQRGRNAAIEAEQDHQHEQIFDQQMQIQKQQQDMQRIQQQIDDQKFQQTLDEYDRVRNSVPSDYEPGGRYYEGK